MKKRLAMILMATLTASMLLSGCGSSKEKEEKKSTEKQENEEEKASVIEGTLSTSDDAASILKTANAAYAETTKRGTDFESTILYEGGGATTTEGSTSYDADKDIFQSVYQTDDQGKTKELYTKENNQYYTYYMFEEGDEERCIRFRKQAGGDDTELERQEKGHLISFLEAGDDDSVSYETVGEEEIDGVQCVQILIKATILSESEEDMEEELKIEGNLWVQEESHLPVKMKIMSYNGDEPVEESSEEESADIDLSADDSDALNGEDVINDYGQTYTTITDTTIYYEDCKKIMDIPTDYENITESDYLNGDY